MVKKIFISYSSKDIEFVKGLNAKLKENGIATFFADESILPGFRISDVIDKALSDYDLMLSIFSENYLSSNYSDVEWRSFLVDEINNKSVKLIPLLIEKVDISHLLKDKKYIGPTKDIEYIFQELNKIFNFFKNEDDKKIAERVVEAGMEGINGNKPFVRILNSILNKLGCINLDNFKRETVEPLLFELDFEISELNLYKDEIKKRRDKEKDTMDNFLNGLDSIHNKKSIDLLTKLKRKVLFIQNSNRNDKEYAITNEIKYYLNDSEE